MTAVASGLTPDTQHPTPEGRHPAARAWLLLLVSTTGLLAAMMMAVVVLSHFTLRIDLTPERRFSLADHTQRVLGGLRGDVRITAFVRAEDPRTPFVEDLLRRFRNASGRVQSRLVDINRNPAIARELGVEHYGTVVVESDGRHEQFPSVSEELLAAAVLQVTRVARSAVYFMTGHGERSPDDADRQRGYSHLGAALRTEAYGVQPLSLPGGDVPPDARVVVIAGPRADFLPGELAALEAYLRRGGALLVLLDASVATPALDAFLARYGIRAGRDVVVDPDTRLFAGDALTLLVPGLSPDHAVSAALRAPPLVSGARSVGFDPAVTAAPDGATVHGIELIRTGPSSWATTNPAALAGDDLAFRPDQDRSGPVPVGASVVVERGGAAVSRLVVIGDADLGGNFLIEYLGNKDLLVNTVNWLAGDVDLVGQRAPKEVPGVNQFYVTAAQGRWALILGTIVEPAVVLLIGAAIVARRRWKG